MSIRRAVAAIVLGFACVALAACGGSGGGRDTPTPSPATSAATAEPSQLSTATATATTTPTVTPQPSPAPLPEVVATMLANVAAARGLAAPPSLAANVISRDELPAVLEAAFTDDDRAWFAHTTLLYRLLGYLGPDQDYYDIYMGFATRAVIGLYDPVNDHLFVVTDGGRGWDDLSGGERGTLAHEIVHALQDYNFALDRTFRETAGDRDRNLAFTAVVEGDAVTHESLAGDRHGLLPVGRLFALTAPGAAAQAPAPIERELRFPYQDGAAWVRDLRDREGIATIDALLRDPPASTAVILHPERGIRWQPDRPSLPDLAASLGAGWAREATGPFGEFHWMNLLQTQLPGLEAATAATAWTGDDHAIYTDGADAVGVFRVRAGSALGEAVAAWLDRSADAAPDGAATRAAFRDGRHAILQPVADGFLLVIATSDFAMTRTYAMLSGG